MPYTFICAYKNCRRHFKSKKWYAKFCSMKCFRAYSKIRMRGVRNPKWAGGEFILLCEHCGAQFVSTMSDSMRGWAKFCSRKCVDASMERDELGHFIGIRRK